MGLLHPDLCCVHVAKVTPGQLEAVSALGCHPPPHPGLHPCPHFESTVSHSGTHGGVCVGIPCTFWITQVARVLGTGCALSSARSCPICLSVSLAHCRVPYRLDEPVFLMRTESSYPAACLFPPSVRFLDEQKFFISTWCPFPSGVVMLVSCVVSPPALRTWDTLRGCLPEASVLASTHREPEPMVLGVRLPFLALVSIPSTHLHSLQTFFPLLFLQGHLCKP